VLALATPRPDADVDVRLLKAGAISGRIIDTLGDPVIGMTVTAEMPAATESDRKVVATCQTDDLGEYRLAGLPEGRFFVSLDTIAPVVASVKAGRDGAFSVRNLAPGDYWAAALTQVKPGEWRDPDLLEALIPSATHVAISEGDTVTTDLRAVTR
jgi:hypothetical protein